MSSLGAAGWRRRTAAARAQPRPDARRGTWRRTHPDGGWSPAASDPPDYVRCRIGAAGGLAVSPPARRVRRLVTCVTTAT
ncbi:protein of unknown function [Modestobacter italicus]|uniref:Uncharacterized protein n=1 Tax=Modestobacter italicus (strain DSM 44449 / CECT 9708 / BC 501) TaxID=2732864 RepID=I4EY06_MODI5|nr:protein of unknown function [Modestobacter marinus]